MTRRTWLGGVAAAGMARGERTPLSFDVTWVNPPAETPRGVTHHVLKSASMGREVGFNVYLPPAYAAEAGRRFPVIYWLHGAGGNESTGMAVAREFDRLLGAGLVEPAILVFPNGGKKTEYRDWAPQNVRPETMIIGELIPHVDATWRTRAEAVGRALEGMSMGANGALKLALKYPERFGSVVTYAGSYMRLPLDGYFPGVAEEQQRWIAKLAQWWSAADDVFELAQANSARLGELRIRFVVGSKDVSMGDSEGLHAWLKARGIPHEYELLLGVGHDSRTYYARSGLAGFRFQAAAWARPAAG